jgi:hypothetical protein
VGRDLATLRGGGPDMGPEARLRVLREMLSELQTLRNRIPESVADGSLEEALMEVSNYVPSKAPLIAGTYRILYTDLSIEAKMLAQLAAAMRIRMARSGSHYISGLDYMRRRLDDFIARLTQYTVALAATTSDRRRQL